MDTGHQYSTWPDYPEQSSAAEAHSANETPSNRINVSWPERLVSATAGALLLSSGLRNFFSHPLNSMFKTVMGGYLLYRGASGNCFLYSQIDKSGIGTRHAGSVNIRTSMVVNRPRLELYEFWRKLENLPLFMRHLASVQEIDAVHSHWVAILPGDLARIKWNAEIVKEEYGYLLGWKSVGDSDIDNAGKVEFRDTAAGTELRVVITYRPPAGNIGVGIAKLLNPVFEELVRKDIHNFKEYIEEGNLAGGVTL